ncbi:tyrosine-type recombinase/integrase [Govanella unica]|uniref:Integrase arm-type DNA-binding domain-containing protein n=1 Tax=Govanella unica TaxID=2975056 RepID=A0A9X3TW54_9PROT|nr:integrase arm-type DNA-binding domain-containing protein [Govania unica]MDA5192777.1 integrase arm-type DNA-binding domain-containing protein [Govania unica]
MAALTDAKVRAAKAGEKPYKLSDGSQLYLHVTVAGGRHWRMNYQFGRNPAGKPVQKTLTIGSYPAISLKDAREARDRAKALLARGIEPTAARVTALASPEADEDTLFEAVARRWHTLQKGRWSAVHSKDVLDSLENDVFPKIGTLQIGEIKAPQLLDLLNGIVARGAIETAHRLRQRVSAIFVYGIATGIAEADPAASLAVALPRKPRTKRQPALIDLASVRQMLISCEAERCRAVTKLGLRFLALTAVRPGELRWARWAEIEDLDGAEPLWRIPSHRMKGDEDRKADAGGDHLVPLAPQSVEVLRVLHRMTGNFDLMFPGERHAHRPISENTLRALLIRAGYYQRHVPHGFRAAFSTIMNERAKAEGRDSDRAIIDLMLAHVPPNKIEGAYNRADYLKRRREIACEWADLLVAGMCSPEIHLWQPIRWAATGPGRPVSRMSG